MTFGASVFQSVFAALPMPALLVRADTPRYTIVDVNEAYCVMTGLRRSAIISQAALQAFPEIPFFRSFAFSELISLLQEVSTTGDPGKLSSQNCDLKDELPALYKHCWDISASPIPDESGSVGYLLITVTDVTEQYQLRAHIETADRTNTLLYAIIDSAQAGIFLFKPVYNDAGVITDFRFEEANRMLAAYVGQTSETVKGALGSDWFPGYKTNGLFDKYSHTAITGITNRFEFHYDVDGIDVWLDIMSSKVNEDILVTFTDYTALKNLQRRLEEHVTELRGSNANLEQFAYIASHDLQEPLRKVKSFGDMLQSRYGESLGPGGADIITRMQSAAARMSTLIDDLLTYSRASVKPAELQVIDANKILDGVLLDLERVIAQKKAIIRHDNLLPITGQPTQIGQIFLNLVGNALKFCDANTVPEVMIHSEVVKGRNAGFRVSGEDADKKFQLIRVSDNGIGFDNTYRERIFQIFQRLNTRSEFSGSGVGLSIVRKVVENHGGYIQASSEPGKGSIFSVLLPAPVEAA